MSRSIGMHVHSFSLRFHLRYEAMNVFDYIDHARAQGFTGVNISANGPGFRDLGGISSAHLASVRQHLTGMPCEIDTSSTEPEHVQHMLGVATAVGADTLRTYTRHTGDLPDIIERTIGDLVAVGPMAADAGVLVVLENHEDFTGPVIARILAAVDHPSIRALYDYGNSQMVGEDPIAALEAMAPYTARVHAKDHEIVEDHHGRWVQGVPMGAGRLPIIDQTNRLYAAGVRRFCFENVWSYVAPLRAATTPDTPPFIPREGAVRIDGNLLAPVAAIEQERIAFDQGWSWFRRSLQEAGYTIEAMG
ncbi:MAG: sugar phosphate isomerase/epimerase family protein [Acidimicrobiia bacterium]